MFHMMNADLARDQYQERIQALEAEHRRALSRDPLSGTARRQGRHRPGA